MSSFWYNKVTDSPDDYTPLIEAIGHFELELANAAQEVKIKGRLEKASAEIAGIMTYRYNQLQELESIIKYLDLKLTKIKGSIFRNYLENYARTLSSRDAEKYAESDDKVYELALLINQVALVRNQFLGITKGLEVKHWQINSITKLKVAGFEDHEISHN